MWEFEPFIDWKPLVLPHIVRYAHARNSRSQWKLAKIPLLLGRTRNIWLHFERFCYLRPAAYRRKNLGGLFIKTNLKLGVNDEISNFNYHTWNAYHKIDLDERKLLSRNRLQCVGSKFSLVLDSTRAIEEKK